MIGAMQKSLIIASLLLAVLGSMARDGAAEETISSDHYLLTLPNRFDAYTEPIKKFLDAMDGLYDNFYSGIGLRRQRYTQLKVVAYADPKAFNAARAQMGVASPFVPAAYYTPRSKTAYVYNRGTTQETLSSLLHEISHHYIREFVADDVVISVCLDEGLAELVDSSPMQGTGISVNPGLHLDWGRMVSRTTQAGNLPPIEKMLGVSLPAFQSLTAQSHGLTYAECWAFSRFLLNGLNGKLRPLMVHLLTAPKGKPDWNALITQGLPAGLTREEFDKAWQAFAANPS